MSFLRLAALATLVACTAAHAAEPEAAAPYVLKDTEVRTLHAARLGRDYEIDVALPPSYASAPDRKYPVVFVTDAPYAFPLTRAIAARIGGHSKAMPEFILVGLGYAKGDTPEFSRRRDYTPSAYGVKDARSDMPGRAPAFGEAEAYRRFVADEVFPFVAAHWRADMAHRIFAGHSYGSLWGAWVLATAPEMFEGYVLGSPSLWYDHGLMFERAKAAAATRKDLRAAVYLGVGGFETRAPKSAPHDPRYDDEVDMAGDMHAYAQALAAHRWPGLRVRTDVVAGENHLTVAPILITHGLEWVLAQP
jgi:predicted alpha/beta superfamily hydrolase